MTYVKCFYTVGLDSQIYDFEKKSIEGRLKINESSLNYLNWVHTPKTLISNFPLAGDMNN